MKKVIVALLLLFPGVVHAAGKLYVIDPAQTHVRFAAKMCLADILIGEFRDVRGSFYFDEKDPEKSHVEVKIRADSATFNKNRAPAASVHNGQPINDVITSKLFLNTIKFPDITYRSTKIHKTSNTTADVTGEMTVVGVTLPFTMEITFHDDTGMTSAGRQLAAFSAYGKFKRSHYGITYGLDRIGIRRMDDEITILIDVAGNSKE